MFNYLSKILVMADDIYVVEKILDKKLVENGQVEYFIKWFGYDEEEATWEPEENVFCKDLIEQYECRQRVNERPENVKEECQQILSQLCDQIEKVLPASDSKNMKEEEEEDVTSFQSFTDNEYRETLDILSHYTHQNGHENGESQSVTNSTESLSRKRTNTAGSLTRKKKLRSDSIDNPIATVDENANDIHTQGANIDSNTIDYLSLEPERIVSITRSRTPAQQLEFLIKCARQPTKLYFISNEKAKELIPDLLIEFYERHINWFIDRPTFKQKLQRQKS